MAAVLGVSALLLIVVQGQQLTSNLDASLEQRADAYEASIALPIDRSVLLNSNDEDRAVQLVAADGSVIAATPNLDGVAPLDLPLAGDSTQTIENRTYPQLEDDAFRVLSRRVQTDSGPAVLHVAQNIDDLNDAVRWLTVLLALTVPAVVAVLGALVWWLVGRTLRPVESIRAEVADISGSDLDRRVPVSDRADEIARLATTMNAMLDRLDASSRRQRQFVADASHELRTPITRIRTEVEVDLQQPDRADPPATNATVLEETIALQRLLDDLLFLARSDEDRALRSLEPTDLDDIVLTEIRTARAEATIEIDGTGVSAAHLLADPDQLRRVVRNLLENAIRYATERVAVDVHEQDDTIHLSISDDGAGIEPDARAHIFERFGRADDARTRAAGGSGLGLAIVRDIIDRHGGSVRYDSSWTGGARFVVSLPAGRTGITEP